MHAITRLTLSILFFVPLVLHDHVALAAPLGEVSARHNAPRPQQINAIENDYSGPAGNSDGGIVREAPAQHSDNTPLGGLSVVKLFSGELPFDLRRP